MANENIKYIIVKNNCALMECYMGGQLAYFFTDKSDGTYYNTLDRGYFDRKGFGRFHPLGWN